MSFHSTLIVLQCFFRKQALAWHNEDIPGPAIELNFPMYDNPFDEGLREIVSRTRPGLELHLAKINTQYDSSGVYRFRLKRAVTYTPFTNLLMKCAYRQKCSSQVNAKLHVVNVQTGQYSEHQVLDQPFDFNEPSRSTELVRALSNESILTKFKRLAGLPSDAAFEAIDTCPLKFAAISFMFMNQKRTTFTEELVPISVGCVSNVPDYEEPRVFISDGNPGTFIKQWLDHLYAVSNKAASIMEQKFQGTLDQLTTKIGNYKQLKTNLKNAMKQFEKVREEQTDKQQELQRTGQQASYARAAFYESDRYEVLRVQLMRWIRQLPVIGFNSVSPYYLFSYCYIIVNY